MTPVQAATTLYAAIEAYEKATFIGEMPTKLRTDLVTAVMDLCCAIASDYTMIAAQKMLEVKTQNTLDAINKAMDKCNGL
jgi:hypothetical protein